MKDFLLRLLTLGLFILSFGLFYIASTVVYTNPFVFLLLGVCAFFTFIMAWGCVDRLLGYGNKGKEDKDSKNKS